MLLWQYIVAYIILTSAASVECAGYSNRHPYFPVRVVPGGRVGGGVSHQSPFGGLQPQTFNLNRGSHGFDVERVQHELGCPRPTFTDEAKFEVEGCRDNIRQDWNLHCTNIHSRVPYGKSGIMSCLQGRRLLRLTSLCTNEGIWKPSFVENCDKLFNLLDKYKGNGNHNQGTQNPTGEEYERPEQHHCPKVNIKLTPNFLVSCHPGQTNPTVENCMDQFTGGVPSGTKISIKCRPPYHPLDNHLNELVCQDGQWEGKIKQVVCAFSKEFGGENVVGTLTHPHTSVSSQLPNSGILTPTTTTTIPTTTTLPTTTTRPTTTTLPTTTTTTLRPTLMSCPPLKGRSASVQLTCVFGGEEVGTNDCSNTRLPVGTEAKYTCANYHESTSTLPTLFRKCKEDGTWSGSSEFTCIVQCGRENVVKVPFITHSLPTLRGQWPWHAALFRNTSRDKDNWEYICGGTLLTKNALITAGHCVTLLQTTQVVDLYDLRIHMGKYRREENDENVQIKEIKEIIVNPNYNPYNYDSDLAIIVLKTEVSIGYFVRPICFLSTTDSALEDLQLADNSIGTVVGWGYDENHKLADDLRMAHLRVVGSRECAKSMIGSSVIQLNSRSTSFCAGYSNGTNVCNGDSGSGMYFPTKDSDNTKWYIQGLVSVGFAHENGRCKPEEFSVFTRLGRYADFITRMLSEHDAF